MQNKLINKNFFKSLKRKIFKIVKLLNCYKKLRLLFLNLLNANKDLIRLK